MSHHRHVLDAWDVPQDDRFLGQQTRSDQGQSSVLVSRGHHLAIQWRPAFDYEFIHVHLLGNFGEIVRHFTISRKHITVDLHGFPWKKCPLLWTIIIEMDFTILVPVLLGWIAGLFVNYASDVLPATRRFSQPACPNCQTTFPWLDYLTLRACRNCGTRRSLRTWVVLILSIASFTYFWLFPPHGLGLPLSLIVLTYFGVIIVIDLEHRLILHPTSLFGAILGLIVGTAIYSKNGSIASGAFKSVLGGVAGFGIMFGLYQLGALVARIRARKMRAAGQAEDDEEALGGGDVFLTGVLGLMLGWPDIILGITAGALVGGIVGVLALVGHFINRRYNQTSMMTFIPYGPSLVIGAAYILYLLIY
jgi:leader peptidase (prepilin peptidase)/N-methyltransferase